ncbi:MAG: hypothetical protein M0Z91_01405 [Actinomycetota bacterium]|nr:hypothetical protein [Actinomycetota bacterium]
MSFPDERTQRIAFGADGELLIKRPAEPCHQLGYLADVVFRNADVLVAWVK